MDVKLLGRRRFDREDQVSFAKLSGDRNPMHMDPVLARRTQAGAPVVHGVHSALVGLELAAQQLPVAAGLATIKATFSKMVYVGDLVDYQLKKLTDKSFSVEGAVDGVRVFGLVLKFGEPAHAGLELPQAGSPDNAPVAAIDLSFEQMATQGGCLSAPATDDEIRASFPAASQLWSSRRIAGMIATTLLIGMVCPGLHSIYAGFTLHATELEETGLRYRVASVDPRFRMVCLQVQGSGIQGELDSFARTPPVAQPTMSALAGLCAADEFANSTALIVGGSRGLGELTAKVLALGGAKIIVTYATGKKDADAVAFEINNSGGSCQVLAYDFHFAPSEAFIRLAADVTHLYYFATPQIVRRKAGLFDQSRFNEFERCYVSAFNEIFQTLHAGSPQGLTAFYPSTVFITERPRETTEYAMAKAAGEILCEDITAFLPKARVVISRLPALPTDQTAGIASVETADPIAVMLPLIRQVQHS